jgi:RHS repeat-associated protein
VAQTSSATAQTVAGHTSAAITSATVDAVSATISHSTNFTANVKMPSGTNVISVGAQPSATGSSPATQRYQIVATGSAPTSLSYDLNGNVLTDESGNSYQWDALNRLTQITYPSAAYTTFAYDGLGRRVQIAESTSSIPKNYLWIGSEIAEERNGSNTATERFFPQGEQQSGTNYYYTRDHLGSVREMCNSSGSIVATYSYDPYGRTTLVSGSNVATFQYAGYYQHQESGLEFAMFRAFDPNTGRWINRDPIGEFGGLNNYSFTNEDPINAMDPMGLAVGDWWDPNTYTDPAFWQGFNQGLACWGNCMADLHRQLLALGSGLGGSALLGGGATGLNNIPIPKTWLPEAWKLARIGLGGGVEGSAGASEYTSALRVLSVSAAEVFGVKSLTHLTIQQMANLLKREGLVGGARIGLRYGPAGISLAEGIMSLWCGSKCASCP